MEKWNDYFSSQYNGGLFIRQKYETKTFGKQYNIYQCSFIGINGGALIISSNDVEIMHNECFFVDCTKSGSDGGAIQIVGCSNVTQYRATCIRCSSMDSKAQFCSIDLSASKKNFANFIESYVSYCTNSNNNDVTTLKNGVVGASACNISGNEVSSTPGFTFASQVGPTAIMNYSLITGTYSTDCFTFFCGHGGNYKYFRCNIINCTQNSNSGGTFYAYESTLTVQNCTLLKCCDKNGALFGTDSATIYVNYCNYDKYKTSGAVTPNNNNINDITNELSFFVNRLDYNNLGRFHCIPEISCNTISPIIYSILITPLLI